MKCNAIAGEVCRSSDQRPQGIVGVKLLIKDGQIMGVGLADVCEQRGVLLVWLCDVRIKAVWVNAGQKSTSDYFFWTGRLIAEGIYVGSFVPFATENEVQRFSGGEELLELSIFEADSSGFENTYICAVNLLLERSAQPKTVTLLSGRSRIRLIAMADA